MSDQVEDMNEIIDEISIEENSEQSDFDGMEIEIADSDDDVEEEADDDEEQEEQ